MFDYVGNSLQIRGAEQYTLHGGRGEGMKFLYIRNGLGLEVWISLDRAGDVSRICFKGDNMGYFSPCGYAAPQYYEKQGAGFLKSFTAGFFTTCGLTAVGSPCTDDGEELPLHGTVSNIPSQLNAVLEDEGGLTVMLTVEDAVIFGRKLTLRRRYFFSYKRNCFSVNDTVINCGDNASPYMLLYHCNMGYPLVSENSIIKIPHSSVSPRNEHSSQFIDTALKTEKPQPNYEECCFYYDVEEINGAAVTGIYNPEINRGVILSYSKQQLPFFTEWKMMGRRDYVIGLEPGNCTPDGRDIMRKNGTLKFLNPGESGETELRFIFADNGKEFENEFKK